MIITNNKKIDNEISELTKESLPFTQASLFKIQDIIEVNLVEYSEEDVENETFLRLVAENWPENYDSTDFPETYNYYLEYRDDKYIDVYLAVELVNNVLVIKSVSLIYNK